jgi:phenylalanyl-tRNA synthetase alpha chain
MLEKFDLIKEEAQEAIAKAVSLQELESLKGRFLGRKSALTALSNSFGSLSPQERPQAGRAFNRTKNFIAALIEDKKKSFAAGEERLDITFAAPRISTGSKHPVSIVVREICDIFAGLGFEIQEGREVEDEWHNFQALNIPLEHPSRDMFDTFYLDLKAEGKYKHLLRSHTSPSQIRLMKKRKPPVAFIVPGRVYRPDAVDASHSFMFHQIEGFAVDKQISFSQLKGSLVYFARHMFSSQTKLRFRPSFFPFTEPSAEVDISCIICKGKGCSVCKRTGWVEVLGCGMIHPNVLKACAIDPAKYRGFAFGMGIERIAMLKFGINDIRLFFENDVRFLEQFYEI